MGAVEKGSNSTAKKKKMWAFGKSNSTPLVSWKRMNSRVKRMFRLTGEAEKVCHRAQANMGLLGSPNPSWRMMLTQGNLRKLVTGPGRQMPARVIKTPPAAGCVD